MECKGHYLSLVQCLYVLYVPQGLGKNNDCYYSKREIVTPT